MGSGSSLESGLSAVEEVARTSVATAAAEVDSKRAFPSAGVKALADAGALGLVIGADAGGLGGSLEALAVACEAVGAACASTGMVFLMHAVTAATLGAGGGGAKAEHVLKELAQGKALGTLAFSERGTGAHFYAPGAAGGALERLRDDLGAEELRHLRRSRRRLPGAAPGRVGGDARTPIWSDETSGASSSRATWNGLGMAGNSSVALELDGVELGADARVGGAGKGIGARLRRRRPFLPRRPGGGQRRHRGGGGRGGDRARSGSDAMRTGRHSPRCSTSSTCSPTWTQRAERPVCSCARRRALGEAGDESALVAIMEAKVVATGDGGVRDPDARSTRRAARATRRRCRSSVTSETRAPER